MHSTPEPSPAADDDAALPAEWLAALRDLPSERATVHPATDAAILAEARASLAAIRRRKNLIRLWLPIAAAACLAAAITFLVQRGIDKPIHTTTAPEDPYAVILREVTSLFPHQVRAIKTDGGELQIALSEQPLPASAQPVVIEACGNGGCTVVITYVGQVVEIEGQHITVKAEENGVTILESKSEPAPDLQITSRTI